jgi:hypothetical protein
MKNTSENGIPKLNKNNIDVISTNPELSQLFKELGDYHGHTITVQTQNGSKIPFRINDVTFKAEIFKDNKWQEVGV